LLCSKRWSVKYLGLNQRLFVSLGTANLCKIPYKNNEIN
jgi:hypothetical protein